MSGKFFVSSMMSTALICLVACGSPDRSGMYCSPGPQISSAPPTTATVGYRYSYSAKAVYVCGTILPVTCNNIVGIELPPGAVIGPYYDSIAWTPAADQVNTDVRFVIATETDACGNRATKSWLVHIYPAPVIQSFTSTRPAVNPGEATTITAVFDGSGSIEGIGPITSGVSIAIPALTTSTSFTLVVSNGYGAQVRQTITIPVLIPPSIHSFTAYPTTITAGGTAALVWSATGDYSAHIGPSGMNATSSPITVAPATTTTYVLTLSNAAGASVSASVQVVVVAPPVIESFTATPASSILRGHVSLAALFRNGTGEIILDNVTPSTSLGPVVSGAAVDSGELLRNALFRLVVRNVAGAEATQTLSVPIFGPGTFQPTIGQPNIERSGHSATRLLDGRVFIAGGRTYVASTSTTTSSTEIFDPATETFTAGPSLLEGRYNHATALLPDGRALLVGGYRTDTTRIINAEIYDPVSGTITSAGRMPAFDMVLPQTAELPDGRVLVVHTSLGQGSEVFEPSTNQFTAVGPLNDLHACVSLARLADGRVLVVDGSAKRASEVFTPSENRFYKTAAVSYERCYLLSPTLLDGRVLITSGSDGGVPAEIYDPATGLFSDVGTPHYDAHDGATATTLVSGLVLVVGGNSPWAELFDAETGAFAMTGGSSVIRRSHTATLLKDGRVLIVGGTYSTPEAELYTPE